MSKIKNYFPVLLIMMIAYGCSSTDEAMEIKTMEDYSESYLEEKMPFGRSLDGFRTQLSDVYSSRTNEIPEGFARIKVEKEVERNLYEGYRVQIYSGQSVEMADSIDANFRAWSDTTIAGYQAETYVSFRTPYFKVHVGDFHERDRAISFSNIVKRQFRDAWVVYDKVDPQNVPADTVQIEIKKADQDFE